MMWYTVIFDDLLTELATWDKQYCESTFVKKQRQVPSSHSCEKNLKYMTQVHPKGSKTKKKIHEPQIYYNF